MNKEELRIRYVENILNAPLGDFRRMENVDSMALDRVYYLGDMDADKEWNDNPDEARRKFLHTEAYEKFLDEHAIILLGRTGTGKTAILRCIEEDVKRKKLNTYAHVVKIYFSNILKELNNNIKIDKSQNTFMNINSTLEAIINIEVMRHLVENGHDECTKMKEYLTSKGIIRQSGINHWLHTFATQMRELKGNDEKVYIAINASNLYLSLVSGNYDIAYEEMLSITKKEKVLVLIDTMDHYDLNDENVVIPVKSLVSTCFKFYNSNMQTKIHVNIALASEVYTHILHQLPGKQQGNTVVIQWRFKNLINLIAIRFYDWCCKNRDKSSIFEFIKDYKLDDFFNVENNKSREFLHNILPEFCCTSLDFNCPTLPYCIRHTMKKPRELMLIFNAFIGEILRSNNVHYFIENPDKIKQHIHSTQHEMISSALSMYATMYPDIDWMCHRVLGNKKFLFTEKDIENSIKEVVARSPHMDDYEIKRILFESGLVGVMNNLQIQTFQDKQTRNKMEIYHIAARFEYQMKGKLGFNKEDFYVIHPMCYEHFTCYLDSKTLVYPTTEGDDSDVLQLYLKDK